jgi:outer membrane protein TolC
MPRGTAGQDRRHRPGLGLASAAVLLNLSLSVAAQDALTLAEALARGRSGAREVMAARARQRAAEARAKEAAGYRLPQIRLSQRWIRTDSPADSFGMLLNQERFSFPEFVSGNPNDPDTLETAITRFEIELPIWTGGEISTRIRQAKLVAGAAGERFARAGDEAAFLAAEAWIRLAQARESVALLEKARETVAAHVALAKDYLTQGMLVRSDVLRAEVELARLDDLLAEARGNARVAEANLGFRLGEPLGTSYTLATLIDPPKLTGSREQWGDAADARRDLGAARKLVAANELEADARRGGLFPRIGVIGHYDLVDDQPLGSNGDATTIMAVASWELFDGGRRRASIASARADAEAGRADVERFAEGIRLEVKHTFETADVALERRATAAAALEAADEAVRITTERFRAGVVKTTDVLDATTARREAEMRELVARAEAWLAQLRLALAAGEAPESILKPSVANSSGRLSP